MEITEIKTISNIFRLLPGNSYITCSYIPRKSARYIALVSESSLTTEWKFLSEEALLALEDYLEIEIEVPEKPDGIPTPLIFVNE